MIPLNHFDLNLLVVFEAIYAEGGVSAAARRLNLSQPAISHALTRLRDALSDRLFVRESNRLVPTAFARAMAEPVRDALRSFGGALAGGTAFDPATSDRHFKIGLRLSGEVPNFVELVRHAREQAPGIVLSSVNFRRRDLTAALAEGRLDVALDIERARYDLSSVRLERDGMVVIARAGHPMIHGRTTLEDYLSLDHVLATPRSSGLGIEDGGLERMGRSRRIIVRCQHAATAWDIVASSELICTLPRHYAAALNASGKNQIVDLPFDLPPNELRLYWHAASEADPGGRWLRAMISKEYDVADRSAGFIPSADGE